MTKSPRLLTRIAHQWKAQHCREVEPPPYQHPSPASRGRGLKSALSAVDFFYFFSQFFLPRYKCHPGRPIDHFPIRCTLLIDGGGAVPRLSARGDQDLNRLDRRRWWNCI
jgi:hypothetical protein